MESGTVISHYRITRKLGQGGMGEVYLAEDTKLQRPIALKLLTSDLANDTKRRQRFMTEARRVRPQSQERLCDLRGG